MDAMPTADEGKLRLFVAIEPPESVREVLARVAVRIRGVTWTPPHQYHLTLRFLGDVAEHRLDAVEEALAGIRVEPFLLPVGGVGSFPPRRPPRVIWAGVGTGHPRLFQLRQKIDDALLACGLDLDVRTFHPHFSLGRCTREARTAAVANFLHAIGDFAGPLFRVDAFTLFRSELTETGAEHTPLQTVSLPTHTGNG